MTALSVNLNKVALIRNTRSNGIPSVVHAARIALEAGADGITVHPRPDGPTCARPMSPRLPRDARLAAAEFNVEGNPSHGLLDYVQQVRPQQCTCARRVRHLRRTRVELARADRGSDPQNAQAKSLGVRVSLLWTRCPRRCSRGSRRRGSSRAVYRAVCHAFAQRHCRPRRWHGMRPLRKRRCASVSASTGPRSES